MARGRRAADAGLIGMNELQNDLLSVLGAVAGQKQLAASARAAMKPVRELAQSLVPRDTGVLKESIIIATVLPDAGTIVASAGLMVRKSAHFKKLLKGSKRRHVRMLSKKGKRALNKTSAHWRWHFVEKGTSKMKATPFLRPAFAIKKEEMLVILRKQLVRRLNSAVKRKSKEWMPQLPPGMKR